MESNALGDALGNGTTVDESLRLLHPNLWRATMTTALWMFGLGVNFLIFTPTYDIFGMPNQLWAALALLIAGTELVCLNFILVLRYVRMAMALSIWLSCVLAVGTCQPFIEGVGSLQLPIMYAGLAALQFPLLLEAPVNPWTKR